MSHLPFAINTILNLPYEYTRTCKSGHPQVHVIAKWLLNTHRLHRIQSMCQDLKAWLFEKQEMLSLVEKLGMLGIKFITKITLDEFTFNIVSSV